jgi:lipopolysaccharide/colanic/teichoic acid biosynthesis glycosyltransferase
MTNVQQKLWLLILPILAWFYIGLFATMWFWYPDGISNQLWREHVINFSVIYLIWFVLFFVYTLFDQTSFRSVTVFMSRFLVAVVSCVLVAAVYFYFQPELLLTPRRFLLVHALITFVGIGLWYAWVQYVLPRIWQRNLFVHPKLIDYNLHLEIADFISDNKTLGWNYNGEFHTNRNFISEKTTIILPAGISLSPEELSTLFKLKQQGVEFLEHPEFYELTQRRVSLNGLNEVWFLRSVNYRQRIFDLIKRLIDIAVAIVGLLALAVVFPFIAALIKLSSRGSILFTQFRVGQFGEKFKVYKFRTMSMGQGNTWTADKDLRITSVGKILRKLRVDELPQFINIFLGNMSLVGPRPEQVNIVEELKTQIPYYNERHIVKPGLTGWSQLHVYANSVEGTRLKLQYDLYYIKHRSLWFDLEIILRTIFHIMTLRGQ